MNTLNLNQVTLRPWSISDLEQLVEYANNPKISSNLTNVFPYPYLEEHGRRFIEFATKDDPIHIFAIDLNGKAIGGIGVHPQSDIFCYNAELGYWIAEPYWGQGIATFAIQQIVEFAFNTFDINRLFARPFGSNLASQKVLEKTGFILEGRFEKTFFKNGQFEDELIYAIRRK